MSKLTEEQIAKLRDSRYMWAESNGSWIRVEKATGLVVAKVFRATIYQYGTYCYGTNEYVDAVCAKHACEKDWP